MIRYFVTGILFNSHIHFIRAPNEEKIYDSKDSFYEELEQVFDHFRKHHMKILLGDFNAKVERENICKLELGMRVYIRIAMIMGLE